MLMNEDLPLTLVFPLLMENFFHPLFDTDREEDTRRIVATLPSPIIRPVPLPAR